MKTQEKGWKPSTFHPLSLRMIGKFCSEGKNIYKTAYNEEEYRELETEDFMDETHRKLCISLMVALSWKTKLTQEEFSVTGNSLQYIAFANFSVVLHIKKSIPLLTSSGD